MQYWDDLITAKSFEYLQKLRREYEFVLIGGWAVFMYTNALKSRDIDIIVDFKTLSQFQKDFHLYKNERLKKYEVKELDFDIDIYVPHYSNPGIKAEEIIKHVAEKEGFTLPIIEMLLLVKQIVFKERRGSIKGEKDRIDIISLLQEPINARRYEELLALYDCKNLKDDLKALLDSAVEVKELGLHQQKMAQLKRSVYKDLYGKQD